MKFWFYTSLILLPFGKILSVRLVEAETKTMLLVPFDLALGMLTLSCILHAWSNRRPKPIRSSISHGTLAFLLWAVFSLVFNVVYFGLNISNAVLSALYLIRWIECFSFFYASKQLVLADPQKARRVVSLLILGAVCFASFGIIQSVYFPDFALTLNPEARPYIDFDSQGHRLVSTFLDPNIAASYISLFCLLSLSQYLHLKERIMPLLILGAALLLTLSRGGILGFGIGAMILLFQIRPLTKGLITITGVFLVLALVTYPIVKDELEERNRISITDDSAMMRLEHIASGLRIAGSNVITGVGFNTLGFVLSTFDVQQEGALSFGFDADFLTMLVLTGSVGLIVYLNIYRLAFKSINVVSRPPSTLLNIAVAKGVLAGTVGALVSSCFSQAVLFPAIMASMWTLWGMVEAQQVTLTDVTVAQCAERSGSKALTSLPAATL